MKNNILITMGILVLLGVAVQGLFGIVAGVFLSAILGIIYGAVKKTSSFCAGQSSHLPSTLSASSCSISA